jgi:hypothetical protein
VKVQPLSKITCWVVLFEGAVLQLHEDHPPQGIRLTVSLDKTVVVLPVLLANVKQLFQRLLLAALIATVVLALCQSLIAMGGVILLLSLVMTHRMITMPKTTLEIQAATLAIHQKGEEAIRVPLETVLHVSNPHGNARLHTHGQDLILNTSLSAVQLQWLDQCLQALAVHRRTQLLQEGHVLQDDPVPSALRQLQDMIR